MQKAIQIDDDDDNLEDIELNSDDKKKQKILTHISFMKKKNE